MGLVVGEAECFLCDFFRDSGYLKHNAPGFNDCDPAFRRALTEPMRVSAGFCVTGLSGNILIHTYRRASCSVKWQYVRLRSDCFLPMRARLLPVRIHHNTLFPRSAFPGQAASVHSAILFFRHQHQLSPPSFGTAGASGRVPERRCSGGLQTTLALRPELYPLTCNSGRSRPVPEVWGCCCSGSLGKLPGPAA